MILLVLICGSLTCDASLMRNGLSRKFSSDNTVGRHCETKIVNNSSTSLYLCFSSPLKNVKFKNIYVDSELLSYIRLYYHWILPAKPGYNYAFVASSKFPEIRKWYYGKVTTPQLIDQEECIRDYISFTSFNKQKNDKISWSVCGEVDNILPNNYTSFLYRSSIMIPYDCDLCDVSFDNISINVNTITTIINRNNMPALVTTIPDQQIVYYSVSDNTWHLIGDVIPISKNQIRLRKNNFLFIYSNIASTTPEEHLMVTVKFK